MTKEKLYQKGLAFIKKYNVVAADITETADTLAKELTDKWGEPRSLREELPVYVEDDIAWYKALDQQAAPIAKVIMLIFTLLDSQEATDLSEKMWNQLTKLTDDDNVAYLKKHFGLVQKHMEIMKEIL